MSDIQAVSRDKISVAIPIYNCVKYLDECFESILSQELDFQRDGIGDDMQTSTSKQIHLTVEISIYEDGSTDGTAQLVDEWVERFQNEGERFSVIISKNVSGSPKGVGYGRNRTIEQSTGEYICFCDSDDIMDSKRIVTQYQLARKYQNALIGSKFRRIPEGSTQTFTNWANNLTQSQLKTQIYLTFGPSIIMPSWFCHRKVFEKVSKGFDESGKGTPEDLIFFYKHLNNSNGDVVRAEQVLLTYRYHPNATTFSVLDTTIWKIRLERLESSVLNQWGKFTIWNAGKSGRKFYRGLSQSNRDKVEAFCDVDDKKLKQKLYHPPYPLKCKVPIIHPKNSSPPFIICVKTELIFDSVGDFRQLLDSLGINEGSDYFYFN